MLLVLKLTLGLLNISNRTQTRAETPCLSLTTATDLYMWRLAIIILLFKSGDNVAVLGLFQYYVSLVRLGKKCTP